MPVLENQTAEDASRRIDALLDEIETLEGTEARVTKLEEVAELYQNELASVDEALIAWTHVLWEDPSNQRAVSELSALADTPERRREVRRALAEGLQHADTPEDASLLYVRLGNWISDDPKGGDERGAVMQAQIEHAQTAGLRLPMLEPLAKAALAVGEPEKASKYFEEIADLENDSEAKARALVHAGRAEEAAKRNARALDFYERARALAQIDLELLGKLVDHTHENSDFEKSSELHRELLTRLGPDVSPTDRARFFYRLGEALRRSRGPADAIPPLEQAQALTPSDRNVLTALASAYSETSAWARLVPTLIRLGEIVEEAPVRAKYFFTAAGIARQELAQTDLAADAYAKALRSDPSLDAALDNLLELLRIAGKLHTLRDVLGNDTLDELIARQIRILRDDVKRTSAYAALFELWRAAEEPAKAWCAAQALEALGTASSDARDFSNAHRPAAIEPEALTETIWYTHVAHPNLDILLTRAFDRVAAPLLTHAPPPSDRSRALRVAAQSSQELRAWLFAALRCVHPHFPLANVSEARVLVHTETLRRELTEDQREDLRDRVDALLEARSELDLQQWLEAMDLTADRVSLVLARDLAAICHQVRTDPVESAAVTRDRRVEELLSYSLSADYLALHQQLAGS